MVHVAMLWRCQAVADSGPFFIAARGRRQLNDLPDDLAAKITIDFYLDARDVVLKALAV